MQDENNSGNGNLTSGVHISCWFEKRLISSNFPMLESNLETEVVIVGGLLPCNIG
jgi:hypothetical protein